MRKIEEQKLIEFKNKYLEHGIKESEAEEYAMDDWIRWKCLSDLWFLAYEVLELKKARYRTGKKEYVLDPVLHKWMCEILNVDEDTLLLVPRFHLKSSMVKISIVQDILRSPDSRIALYSATSGLAESMLKSIKGTLQHPRLLALFPETLVPPGKADKNWEKSTANMLTIKREVKENAPQENQVEAYGVGANITGRHFDKHYYDDLVTKDYVSTQAQIEKLRDWYSYVQSILNPSGIEVMTGTRYHYNDLYNTVISEEFYGKRVYVRSVIENNKPIYKYFTKERIEKQKKKQGAYIFSCQYYNNPVAKEDQLFPPPHPTFTELPDNVELRCYMAVDPAATTKVYSDETAIAVGYFDEIKSILYVWDVIGVKKPGNEIAKLIIQYVQEYKPIKIGIELGLQEHLQYIIQNEVSKVEDIIKQKIPIYIEPINFSRQSKYERIAWGLGSLVRGGQVKIREGLIDLCTQMENFTPNYRGKDDLIDAVSFLPILIEDFGFNMQRVSKEGFELRDWYTIRDLFNTEPQPSTRKSRFVQ